MSYDVSEKGNWREDDVRHRHESGQVFDVLHISFRSIIDKITLIILITYISSH